LKTKFLVGIICCWCLCILLWQPTVLAATTLVAAPDAIAKEIIAKVQSTKNLLTAIDYVNWNEEFRAIPVAERTAAGINSPSQLRTRCKKLITDPTSHMREQLQVKMNGNGADGLVAPMIETMAQGFGATAAHLKQRIINARYTVDPSRIVGSKAVVPVTILSEGETRQQNIKFREIEGRWYVALPREFLRAIYEIPL